MQYSGARNRVGKKQTACYRPEHCLRHQLTIDQPLFQTVILHYSFNASADVPSEYNRCNDPIDARGYVSGVFRQLLQADANSLAAKEAMTTTVHLCPAGLGLPTPATDFQCSPCARLLPRWNSSLCTSAPPCRIVVSH